MSSDKKPLVKRVQAPYYFIKKRKGNEPFLFEELISFLRLHFRDNDIYFYDAKKSQEFVKALRLAFDVVHDDGDGDRLSKIEEIYFYGSSSSGYHIMDKEEDKDPKRGEFFHV
ncbi:uncharacterized protein LOC100570586 [Acyrthosiphon pisum]|uniref:Uncharacterized protein n=1 Tax=Acyrthosiphon pisum TaxID=7029 RepID=A0A8R2H5C4_ACYPI|nr:uncharacterized protein LOC100570586 [Acyrthosiphon pisum]XP_016656043.1 uncharacterized protein LOC100570586 [Acyrthosiphon pisum]|eukprot:XP_016656042.1 PREDICTED: uncharacterized protein LOC100570586 [Acyrthosiphon pisum]